MIQAKFGKSLPYFELKVDISLENSILAIIGPSGAGKTTLLECIAGLQKPSWGDIYIGKRAVFSAKYKTDIPARKRRIGYVLQNYALFPHMTVEKNVLYGRPGKGKTSSCFLPAGEVFKMLGIEHLRRRYPGQISGGEKQRVALARALMTSPELLLLDEPLSALDEDTRSLLQQELGRLQKQWQIPFIMVTHDREEAELLGQQIIRINNGRQEVLRKTEPGRNAKEVICRLNNYGERASIPALPGRR